MSSKYSEVLESPFVAYDFTKNTYYLLPDAPASVVAAFKEYEESRIDEPAPD
jgi:hypothetical protein